MSDARELLAANAAYYHAFATRDMGAMSRIWAQDDVACIHPGWPALTGRAAILDSYRGIFGNPGQEPIVHRDHTAMVCGSEGRVVCVEIVGGLALAATNWFRRIDGAWRMIHHQASPIAAVVEQAPPPGRLN